MVGYKLIWNVMKCICNLFILGMILLLGMSCNSTDENHPLSIVLSESHLNFDEENQYIQLSLDDVNNNEMEATFVISGGDGRYNVEIDNEWSVNIKYNSNKFTVTPMHQGSTVITIKDQSNNTYSLTIDVVPVKQVFVCTSYSYWIEGERLTNDEKKELERDIIAAIPKNRTYVFTYTGKDKGEVEISSKTEEVQKGTFTLQDVTDNMYLRYNTLIEIDGEVLTYEYNKGIPLDSFGKDVTGQYKERFPNLELAIAVQSGNFSKE